MAEQNKTKMNMDDLTEISGGGGSAGEMFKGYLKTRDKIAGEMESKYGDKWWTKANKEEMQRWWQITETIRQSKPEDSWVPPTSPLHPEN